ncbi:hypothetical protein HU200_039533 [Digitaria exilis]|uniref:DEUBAD domain-containing protein n=1 Tax=Digitaria exilis TaxID=1010633 RepID=A0A835EHH5_9POAL|nr:hypothetical protein HU200_039533 [Digitaria exilis]
MTCRMSASKQKKRQINCTNSEQCRPGKKTKFDSSNCLVSLKPHIGLRWDQYLRRVVPEKEQVGILWSDLAPFIESQDNFSGLADVTYVPPETFSLANLRGVLSYEVWSTCLTEAERKLLKQFLPSETDAEENVHLLLTGKNYQFGNPFLSWSSSLCYGDIHPDSILNKEKHIKKAEKAHRINLLNYHSNMVDTLKKWRKRWLSCGDVENLFRDNPGNENQVVMQPKAIKGGTPMKVTQRIDVSKFMSYIKVSRTQLNHIKRLKQSGDGIQTKHVSRVIGGLDKSHVKPYGDLLEDEQRRLREHWLNMSCNDLPSAFEVLKDRKVLMEQSRKLLGLELEEKNVSVSRKANQLTDITNELGQPGASKNDGSPILQNDLVEHSPQSMLQGGGDQSRSLQDWDDEKTKYMENSVYHSDGRNAEDHDRMVVRDTYIASQSEQNSDVQDHNGVSCIDKGTSCSATANNPDEQNEDIKKLKLRRDDLVVNSEDVQEISYKGVNIYSSESQEIKSINFTSTHIGTLDCEKLQLEDLDGVSFKGPSVHERDQDLERICGPTANIYSEASHRKMNTTIVDREGTENVTMVPSNSSSLLPNSVGEQMPVEDFLDLNDQVAKVEKNRWQLAGPLQSHCHPPENIMHDGSGNSHITQPYLSSGQQSSSVYLDNCVQSQQQGQFAMPAFIMDNPSSVNEPLSNVQSNGQLQMMDIGAVSYPIQHANSIEQSTGLHSLPNRRLAQSAPIPRPMQEEHQLTDQNDNCLYAQLHKDYYGDVSFPTKVNTRISEQHSYAAFAPMDHRYNWFPDGSQLHNNNLSGLETGNCLTQALPSGSNTDGTQFSAISQYKQPSVHMGHGGLSPRHLLEPRNQVCPPQNFPRSRDTNTPFTDMYGYTQNMASGTSSQVALVGSLDGSHWTNFIQQNPGMAPDFTNRPFRGPWTR